MSVISPCHLRHEVVRPSQASRVTHSARADVRTRESSIATPPAGNTTETNTAGYQSKKPVVLHQMNQHPPPTRPGWRRVRYARKWFPSWAIGGNASLGRAARGAFACSGPRRATSHRCGRPERTSPSRKSWHRPRCLAERGHRSDREQAGQPAPRSRLRWEPPTIRPPTTGCYPSRPPSPAAVRSAAAPTGAAQVALPYLPPPRATRRIRRNRICGFTGKVRGIRYHAVLQCI